MMTIGCISRGIGKLTICRSHLKCIYENLALEEWYLKNHNFARSGNLILTWSNTPSVVVGRYQNPWLEANVPYLFENDIKLARRYSGGGAVFHDEGNINIHLMTKKEEHNRCRNLQFIAEVLNNNFGVKIRVNKRDDLYLEPGDRKISGTAARIIKDRAYHHLTLLVKADLSVLSKSLKSSFADLITTNATKSVRASAVGYLQQEDANITVNSVLNVLISAFESEYATISHDEVDSIDDTINPGITEDLILLRSQGWIFGKSPQFTLVQANNTYFIKNATIRDVNCIDMKRLIGSALPKDLSLLFNN